MGNTAPRNYITQQYAVTGTTYVEVTGEAQSYLSLYVSTEGLLLSIGHSIPSDATSVEVPAGGSFDLPTGVVGPVHVRSLTGGPTTAYIVSA